MKEWNEPAFVEIRMDAEIGAYQDDFDPAFEGPAFVTPRGTAGDPHDTEA